MTDYTVGRKDKEKRRERVAKNLPKLMKQKKVTEKERQESDRAPEEVLGHIEAECYISSMTGEKKISIEEMKAVEEEKLNSAKRNVRSQRSCRETREARATKRTKRKTSAQAFVPQIVTLTNEKGDLIKAIISVGGEEEERVEEQERVEEDGVVVEDTRVMAGQMAVVEDTRVMAGQMAVVSGEDNPDPTVSYVGDSGDSGLYGAGVHHGDIVYVMET